MKHTYKYILFLLLPLLTNCKDNENWKIVTNVQPGVYISGSATVYSGEAPASALQKITLDTDKEDEKEFAEIVGIYTWLKASGDFQISIAAQANTIEKYGKGEQISKTETVEVASLVKDAPAFKVDKDGFYHIVVNTALKEVNILPVTYGVIGAATPKGWDAETPLSAPTFDDKLTVTWTGKLMMSPGEYKFRYNGGWGYEIRRTETAKSKLFTDLGNFGSASAPLVDGFSQVKPGGPNFTTTIGGEFEFTIQYNLRSRNFTATFKVIGGAVVAPQYPDKMYLVGDATAYAWETPGTVATAEMHKLAGGGNNVGIYWKILHIESGKGFKLSNANWGNTNLGFGEITEFDANGIAVADNGGNMSVAMSGMYTVVLDLRNNAKKLSIMSVKVYGIGDAFGGFDKDKAENLFSVDQEAKTLTSPAIPVNGNVRMYVSHAWIPDWWHSEFNVYDSKIIYRNDGGDQDAVGGTAGQKITLHFDDNTGSIK